MTGQGAGSVRWSDAVASHRRQVAEHIARVALVLSSAHGLAAVSMRQLAERAGVSRPTLYTYFPSVDAAVDYVVELEMSTHAAALAEAVRAEPDATSALRAFCRTHVSFIVGDRHDALVSQLGMTSASGVKEGEADERPAGQPHGALTAVRGVLVGVLSRGVDTGAWSIGRGDLSATAVVLLHLMSSAWALARSEGKAADEVIDLVTAATMRVVGVGRPAS